MTKRNYFCSYWENVQVLHIATDGEHFLNLSFPKLLLSKGSAQPQIKCTKWGCEELAWEQVALHNYFQGKHQWALGKQKFVSYNACI